MVAVTPQVPTVDALNSPLETEQEIAVPSTTDHETVPPVVPPLVDSVSAVPYVPLVEAMLKAA